MGLPTGFPGSVPSPRVRDNRWLSPRTGATGSPPQDPPAGRALGGISQAGLAAPRRLMPRRAAAGQAVAAPLRFETARRSLKGEVFPASWCGGFPTGCGIPLGTALRG